jgi:hypothetical protein
MWVGDYGTDETLERATEELFSLFFSISSNLELCSEEERPLYEKLTGIYLGLLNLKELGMYESNEVARFQDQLNEIDMQRVDGKFLDGKGQIPRGQAMLHTIMNKSYKIAHQLLVNLEEIEGI